MAVAGRDVSLVERLEKEQRVADGATNLLKVFANEGSSSANHELRIQVEAELAAANARIDVIARQIETAQQGSALSRINSTSESTSSFSAEFLHQSPDIPVDSVLDEISRLTSLEGPDLLRCMNGIGQILTQQPQIAHRVPVEDISQFVVPLLDDLTPKDVRSTAHWLLRLLCQTPEDVQILQEHHLDWLLVKSLTRDHRYDLEKQQALLTVRHLLHLSHSTTIPLVSVGLVRAVVALAENGEDRLRFIALETLMELVIRDIELLAAADGIRALLQTLNDGPYELSPLILTAFLFLADRPHLRAYLRPGVDLEIALTGLIEGTIRHGAHEDRLHNSAKLAVILLKSWSGFFFLLNNNRQAIHALVGALAAPSQFVVDLMLDTMFKVFSIAQPEWLSAFVSGKRLTCLLSTLVTPSLIDMAVLKHEKAESSTEKESAPTGTGRASMLDQHICVCLAVFLECGLLEGLVKVAEKNTTTKTSRKAAILIGEILRLANRVLPQSRASHIQALPSLFALVARYDDSMQTFLAGSILHSVFSIYRNQDRLSAPSKEKRARANTLDEGALRAPRPIEASRLRQGMQIDDVAFRNLLLESQVLTAKDHSKWNLEPLFELVDGPLLNPKRLEEAVKGSRFLRRIFAFYHPLERRYSDMKLSVQNDRYTKLICALVTTLLGTPDGIRFLQEDKLFPQIIDCLGMLDPLAGTVAGAAENVFTAPRIQYTCTSGYFELIGTCTQYEEGVALLEHFKTFTLIYHLSGLEVRGDVINAFITNFDYSLNGHPRVLLSKVLTSSINSTRLAATKYLGKLIKSPTGDREWLVRLLVAQLYDVSANIRELAVGLLQEACEALETLEIVVRLRPSLDHLGYAGAPLLFRFLSTSVGVRYLHEIEYIDRGLDEWLNERNEYYTLQTELQLARLFSEVENLGDRQHRANEAPLHFYGELVKTAEGRAVLRAKGHLSDFCEFVRQNGLADHDLEVISKLKSALWAIGNVGSTVGGLPFLEAEDIVSVIVDIAERSLCYSVRGTSYFVLGLISSSRLGAEMLEDLGWDCVRSSLDVPTGLCVPQDLAVSIENGHWTFRPPTAGRPPVPSNPSEAAQRRITTSLLDLGNHVVASAASKVLAKFKITEPHHFENPSLIFRALFFLDNFHYRLPVRRYFFELFNAPFTQQLLHSVKLAGSKLAAADHQVLPHPQDILSQQLPGLYRGDSFAEMMSISSTDDPSTRQDSKATALDPTVTIKGFLVNIIG